MIYYVTIFAMVVNSILGLFILLKNPKSSTNRLFFLFCITNAVWALLNLLSLHPPNQTESIFWLRNHLSTSVLHASLFMLLIGIFPHNRLTIKKRILYPYGAVIMSAIVATQTNLVFSEAVSVTSGQVTTAPGPLIPLFAIAAFGSVVAGLIILVRKYRKSRGTSNRNQLRFLLVGTSLMFAMVFFGIFAPIIAVGESTLTAYLPAFTFPFVGFTAYAIAKHNLLDIRPIIARSVSYTLLLTILTLGYVIALFAASQLIFTTQASNIQIATYTLLALFVAFTFHPLKTRLERFTAKVFYKNHFDTNQLIASITNVMAETIKLSDLTDQSLRHLSDAFQTTTASFWIRDGDRFVCASSINVEKAISSPNQKDLLTLSQSQHIVVMEEDDDADHVRSLRKLKYSVAVPLNSAEKNQGVLLLGYKKSGDTYIDKELEVLRILAPSLATAVENARSYKQISEFNVTLEHEIGKATKDLQAANEKLHKNNQKLRQLDELKDEFISVTSHELRTPLTAIRGYIWMAMNGKNKDKGFDDYMSRAYASTERLITMVNDTLDVSRIESGRMKFTPAPVDIISLTQEVVDNLSAKVVQQQQTITIKKLKSLPLVECDSDKIYQVLTNLIGNAIKFSPVGGKVVVDYKCQGSEVTVRVKDNGPGISKDDQKKLFQKFSRLESATSIPGTGLGLYLCQRIIKLSGGRIWIDSEEGQGAAFLFTLKKSKFQKAPAPKRGPQQFRNISAG